MFPHTITIFNIYKVNGTTTYHRTLLDINESTGNGVFFYKNNQVSDEGKGIANASQYHCIIPLEQLENYVERKEFEELEDKTGKFTLKPNDIVVKGNCGAISSISDLQSSTCDYFTIKSINDSRYGSEDLQNIEVTS